MTTIEMAEYKTITVEYKIEPIEFLFIRSRLEIIFNSVEEKHWSLKLCSLDEHSI